MQIFFQIKNNLKTSKKNVSKIEYFKTDELENQILILNYRIKDNVPNERLLFKVETSL